MSTYGLKGRIIDSVSDNPIEDGIVVIKDEYIEYVGDKNGYSLPNSAKIIEVKDGTIMPGFIDCHVHLTGAESESFGFGSGTNYDRIINSIHHLGILLDAGFTSIRDMSLFGPYLKKGIKRGVIRGSRIMPGGRILSITGGHADSNTYFSPDFIQHESPISFLVDGVDECIKGVRLQFRQGAEFIKICTTGGVSSMSDGIDDIQFSFEELKAIVEETSRHGTYVAAHSSGTEGTYQALLAGVKCIEHGVKLDKKCIELMAKKDVTLVTTLSVSLGVANFSNLPNYMAEKAKNCAEYNLHSINMAHNAGIRIAYGTDYSNSKNTPYSENGKEFSAIVSAGFTPMEAIKIGTINSAYLMKMQNMIGTLEKGKFADIVVVEGNPLKDIKILSHIDNVKVVIKNGFIEKHI